MPKVSIIIPFYNVETYIEQCLKSVINQTLKDIEIICVNDASEDKSREIVNNYAKNDNRIKIIDLEKRQGQGFARNRALEIATGEYIGFVDSDDWIEPDMLLALYTKAKENNDDIVICQAREYDDLNDKFIISDYYSLSNLEKMGNNVFNAIQIKNELLNINVVLWNKIYKKSFLEKTGEKFPEGFIYEDLPFFFGTILLAEKIQIIWENLYIYRINRKNSTMRQFNKKILDRLDMVYMTYEKLKNCDFLYDEINKIKGWIINDLFHRYILLKENYHKEFFFRMKKIFKNLDIEDLENPYWNTIYHFQGYLMVLNNNFESFNQKVFSKYLDIHEIANRLRIELENSDKIDKKISDVYNEISKNYKYTDKFNNDTEKKLQAIKDEFDIEINKLYENLDKNYKYTEKTIENAKELINQKISDAVSGAENKRKEDEENRKRSESELRQKIEYMITTQKEKYEEKIKILEERINHLEKTPFAKIKDKIKRQK